MRRINRPVCGIVVPCISTTISEVVPMSFLGNLRLIRTPSNLQARSCWPFGPPKRKRSLLPDPSA